MRRSTAKSEKSTDRAMLQFKVCLWCGHLQNVQTSNCDKCEAGKIGLGRPRELWAYLDLKIESVLKLPEPLSVVTEYRTTLAKRQLELKIAGGHSGDDGDYEGKA